MALVSTTGLARVFHLDSLYTVSPSLSKKIWYILLKYFVYKTLHSHKSVLIIVFQIDHKNGHSVKVSYSKKWQISHTCILGKSIPYSLEAH